MSAFSAINSRVQFKTGSNSCRYFSCFYLLTKYVKYARVPKSFRGKSMKALSNALLAGIIILPMAPAMAAPTTVVRPQPSVAPVRTVITTVAPATGGMPPDLIVLRFANGRTENVTNPSRAVGGQPHEVVAAQKGIPLPCQAWRPIVPPSGFGFAAEITQTCGN